MKRKGLLAVCLILAFAFFGCENPATETEETALTWGYTITGKLISGGVAFDNAMTKVELLQNGVAVSAYVRPKSDGSFEIRHVEEGTGYVLNCEVTSLKEGVLAWQGKSSEFSVSENVTTDITLESLPPEIVSLDEVIPSVNGDKLTIVFTQNVTAANGNGFSITADPAINISSVAVKDNVLTATLNRAFSSGEKYTLKYDPAAGSVKNSADKPLVAYNGDEVTIRTEFEFDDIYWKTFQGGAMYAIVLKTTTSTTFAPLPANTSIAGQGFTISYSGDDLTFYQQKFPGTMVQETGTDWAFVLGGEESISEAETLTISYDPLVGKVREYKADDSGARLAAFTATVSKKP